jgi:hypothetical protein
LLQSLEACGVLVDRVDVRLEDGLLSWSGTDRFGEPVLMSRAPSGVARIADIVSEQEGIKPKLGGPEIPQGVFRGAGEIPNRFICHRGDIDAGEIPRTRQPSQLHSVTAGAFAFRPTLRRTPPRHRSTPWISQLIGLEHGVTLPPFSTDCDSLGFTLHCEQEISL